MGACLSFAHSVYMTSNEHPELQPIFTRTNPCVNNCEKIYRKSFYKFVACNCIQWELIELLQHK